MLYWFRTPPGVKVGRSALDEDAIRLLEELNPEVEFDWTRILKGEVESRPEPDRRSNQQRLEGSRRGGPPPSGHSGPQRRSTDQRSAEERIATVVPASEVEEAAPVAAEVWKSQKAEPSVMDVTEEAVHRTDELEDGFMPEVELPPEISATAEDDVPPPTAAHARLGSEAVLRLRGRYAELLARLRERVQDPARLEELKGQAERLNPDTWVTDAEVTAGLEQYEEVFESLRALVGSRRRRRRRGPRADAAE